MRWDVIVVWDMGSVGVWGVVGEMLEWATDS